MEVSKMQEVRRKVKLFLCLRKYHALNTHSVLSSERPSRSPSLLSNGYRGQNGWGVKLTNHLHLVPRWIMH